MLDKTAKLLATLVRLLESVETGADKPCEGWKTADNDSNRAFDRTPEHKPTIIVSYYDILNRNSKGIPKGGNLTTSDGRVQGNGANNGENHGKESEKENNADNEFLAQGSFQFPENAEREHHDY